MSDARELLKRCLLELPTPCHPKDWHQGILRGCTRCTLVADILGFLAAPESTPAPKPPVPKPACTCRGPIPATLNHDRCARCGGWLNSVVEGERWPAWIGRVIQAVQEIPDRTSPEDFPEAMLVTADELAQILAVEGERAPESATNGDEHSEIGWLIEMPGPVWWNGGPVTYGCVIWTPASLDAVRFARKDDAEAVIARLGFWNAHATEHLWGMGLPRARHIREGSGER